MILIEHAAADLLVVVVFVLYYRLFTSRGKKPAAIYEPDRTLDVRPAKRDKYVCRSAREAGDTTNILSTYGSVRMRSTEKEREELRGAYWTILGRRPFIQNGQHGLRDSGSKLRKSSAARSLFYEDSALDLGTSPLLESHFFSATSLWGRPRKGEKV